MPCFSISAYHQSPIQSTRLPLRKSLKTSALYPKKRGAPSCSISSISSGLVRCCFYTNFYVLGNLFSA